MRRARFSSRRGRQWGVELLGYVALAGVVACPAALAGRNTPEINYMLNCQGCHLPGGIGHPGIVPNMAGEIGMFLNDDAGRAYLIQVPGAAQSSLDDGELAEVLNWMVLSFDPSIDPSTFKRFDAAEVARYRGTAIVDVSERRRRLLQSVR